MSTRGRVIATIVVAVVMAWQIVLLPSFWLWYVLVALVVAAFLLYQPYFKWLVVWRAKKLGVPFTYTEGPYVLFRGEKLNLQRAAATLEELLDVFVENTDLSSTVPRGSFSVLTWQILMGGNYSVDHEYIRMHRENKKRREQKYMQGA